MNYGWEPRPGLAFVEPVTLQLLEKKRNAEGQNTEIAVYSKSARLREGKRPDTPNRSLIESRNVIAWYLIAAGIPTSDAARLLDVTTSRVRAIAGAARRRWLGSQSIDTMMSLAQHDRLGDEYIESHLLNARRNEMADAEAYLYLYGPVFETSAALRIGRALHAEQLANMTGLRCNCRLCSLFPLGSEPYWHFSRFE